MDLESLDTQPLVDPSDPSLEFIEKKDNLRPLAIFRVDTEFLLCYDGKCYPLYIRVILIICRMGLLCRQAWLPGAR